MSQITPKPAEFQDRSVLGPVAKPANPFQRPEAHVLDLPPEFSGHRAVKTAQGELEGELEVIAKRNPQSLEELQGKLKQINNCREVLKREMPLIAFFEKHPKWCNKLLGTALNQICHAVLQTDKAREEAIRAFAIATKSTVSGVKANLDVAEKQKQRQAMPPGNKSDYTTAAMLAEAAGIIFTVAVGSA